MPQYYVSRIDLRPGDESKGEPAIVADERVLTIKADYHAAHRSYQIFKSLGTPNVGLYCWEKNKKSYAASLKKQKSRKYAKLRIAELEKQYEESAQAGEG